MSARARARSLRAAVVAVAVCATVAGVSQATAAPAPRALSWHQANGVPHVPAHSVDLGGVAAATPLNLDVLLQPRDPAGLQAFAAEVNDPASPMYRHFLAKGQFAKTFGPTQDTIKSVMKALRKQGLTPTGISGNGLDISVRTNAKAAQSAFGVQMHDYRLANGRHAYANVTDPTLAGVASNVIQGVSGLDNLDPPVPSGLVRATGPSRAAQPGATPNITGAGGGPTSCLAAQNNATAEQLSQAYGFNNIYAEGDQGAGVTVGLFELSDYADSDVTTFTTCYNISPTINRVVVGTNPGITQGVGEVMLDIDVAIEIAPKATFNVYVGNSYIGIWNQITSDDTAKVVTTSWSNGCEPSDNESNRTGTATDLSVAASQGQSVFAATGDAGSEDCAQGQNPVTSTQLAVQDPGSQANITGVGGTTITGNVFGPAPTETTWNDGNGAGTGGISTRTVMPSYQSGSTYQGVVNNGFQSGTPCSAPSGQFCREVPDVSALSGSPAYSVYCTQAGPPKGCNGGGWLGFLGTSAAAPLWAGFTALALSGCSTVPTHGGLGFLNPLLYQLATVAKGAGPGYFNDVTTGNNDWLNKHSGDYPAATGYDLATGLGTPIGVPLAAAMCSNPLVTVTVTGTQTIGSSPPTFSYSTGTLPAGVTAVQGPLIDCVSSVTSTTPVGVHNGTITGCQGLTLNGTNAPKYQISYVDGGVTINKATSTTVIGTAPNPSSFGQTFTITATVTSGAPSTPTGTVHFFHDGIQFGTGVSLNGSGVATFTVTNGLPVANYNITAHYDGDGSNLASDSNTVVQMVNKATTTTTLTFTPPNPVINQAVTFTASVAPTVPNTLAQPTGTVSFFIDGSLTPAATVALNSSGQASFTTTFGGGTHSVVAVYNGDGNYQTSHSNGVGPVIHCDVTITGAHNSLIVGSGTTCLSKATISGGITVTKGAVLDIENSTVNGSISANAPLTFRECGSTTGAVTVSAANGFVLIGDAANNCKVNHIKGSLMVANSKHGVVVIGNTIDGGWSTPGDSGTSPLGQPVTVTGNHH